MRVEEAIKEDPRLKKKSFIYIKNQTKDNYEVAINIPKINNRNRNLHAI